MFKIFSKMINYVVTSVSNIVLSLINAEEAVYIYFLLKIYQKGLLFLVMLVSGCLRELLERNIYIVREVQK